MILVMSSRSSHGEFLLPTLRFAFPEAPEAPEAKKAAKNAAKKAVRKTAKEE
ncbi:MAG: hypothetical protein WCK77_25410 [Verrucomicrobiota bacterium]